jgi:hypothetical protein
MAQTINVTGTDCFSLAAKYLGDATMFYRLLAQNKALLTVNGFADPMITGAPIAILVPDNALPSTGGIATQ